MAKVFFFFRVNLRVSFIFFVPLFPNQQFNYIREEKKIKFEKFKCLRQLSLYWDSIQFECYQRRIKIGWRPFNFNSLRLLLAKNFSSRVDEEEKKLFWHGRTLLIVKCVKVCSFLPIRNAFCVTQLPNCTADAPWLESESYQMDFSHQFDVS